MYIIYGDIPHHTTIWYKLQHANNFPGIKHFSYLYPCLQVETIIIRIVHIIFKYPSLVVLKVNWVFLAENVFYNVRKGTSTAGGRNDMPKDKYIILNTQHFL